MDVAPTFLEIAGVTYPTMYQGRNVEPVRGRSMVPLLAGRTDYVRRDDEAICWEFFGWRAVRRGDWKATWLPAPFGVSDWQLFDLATDPGETTDLADTRPELMQELIGEWEAYAEDVGVVLPETTGWSTQ